MIEVCSGVALSKGRGLMLLVALLSLYPGSPASAVVCYPQNQEWQTFIRRTGSNLFVSRGAVGRTMVRDNYLGTCEDETVFLSVHSAVNIWRSNGLDLLEIGWRKIQIQSNPPEWVGFWHYFINGDPANSFSMEFGSNCVINGQLTPGHVARFKLVHVGGNSWDIRCDDDNNGTYCRVFLTGPLAFGQGLASAEAVLYGGSDTTAYTHFTHLSYTNSNNDVGWTAWPGNTWWKNCITGWGHRWIAPDDWDIIAGNPCPS